ncbi:hypothetical protein NPIL_454691 [Nephila pilipes]|uniref:Uncharacterized protein n=1 Tax=Nephila pilipes TaxID=299642 RepID=A0A8X6PB25_NEPPI|nr:hypothetical protein NPIL_454691 [Nephila pilipes]
MKVARHLHHIRHHRILVMPIRMYHFQISKNCVLYESEVNAVAMVSGSFILITAGSDRRLKLWKYRDEVFCSWTQAIQTAKCAAVDRKMVLYSLWNSTGALEKN